MYVFELCVLCGQFMCYEYVQRVRVVSVADFLPRGGGGVWYSCIHSVLGISEARIYLVESYLLDHFRISRNMQLKYHILFYFS